MAQELEFDKRRHLRAISLFDEKVQKLVNSDFYKWLNKPTHKFPLESIRSRNWIGSEGLSEESLDAFVCNLRILIQDRDGLSINSLSKVYKIYGSEDLIEEFETARERWRDYTNQKSLFKLGSGKQNLTQGQLFDILFYGGLAHMNPDKVEDFYRLTTMGAASVFVFGSFTMSIRVLLEVLENVNHLNQFLYLQISPRNHAMIVKTWKGGTLGVRVGKDDALEYFDPSWTSIHVKIDGEFYPFKLRETFWTTCPEIRGYPIPGWLQSNGLNQWPRGQPHRLELTPLGGNTFELSIISHS